ncbi:amidohydrolase [Achromobacter sp. LC458]|uniref:Amidohydrolase n=1 Tax=Achromobacter spanius TaxID=217203 RepID=A0A2S5GPY6_9BURK|nr:MULTISPECIES: M20 aminoacylase family protein [Achromobacter]AYD65543.1 amidohydrolase [Achromobacter sp. B7]MDX3985339.1 M20 aminoacylase family protein [Achromobacter sp.]PPA75028.1 amidohydrolase [Achromobacter spanius]QYJ19671.1 amidohydrolase [Achromobacter sp. ES-001]TRM51332.1 amidohydrolase [Achromobacter sp. LC458]
MQVRDWFVERQPEYAQWRQDLHAHPELSFQEHRTAELVAAKLRQWGLDVHAGIGGTGVVAVLQGERPGKRRIGLRADMDALPMQEKTTLPYRSTHEGTFHGCGHDGHTATLLAVAQHLSQNRDFAGTINFIFQPAEETLAGGVAMMADGLFKRFPCDEIYGLHNNPMVGKGRVAVREGALLAACDGFVIRVHGVGCHGGMPQQGNDPVVIACQLVGMLQTVVSRALDPLESGVVSVGMMNGGTAPNVIPDLIELRGTIRTMSLAARETALRRVREMCEGLGVANATRIDVEFGMGCPPTINAPGPAATVTAAATRVVGADLVDDRITPLMAGEDFAYLLQECPGAYFFVGQDGHFCHHPEYDFDDDILPTGAAVFVEIVRDRLG